MSNLTKFPNIHRRAVLKVLGGSALATPFIVRAARADAKTITVRDPGGDWRTALTAAFYEPFERESGVRINPTVAEHDPTAMVKSQVDTQNILWDVTFLTAAAQAALPIERYYESLDTSGSDMAEIVPEARQSHWMGLSVYATVFAFNTEVFAAAKPKGWSDFWDVTAFPGRRAMRRHPTDTFEPALLADGVDPAHLFPLDIDRALKKLDQIKASVDVWWTGGAQSTLLLKSSEVDLAVVWNGRAQSAIDDGAPYSLIWDRAVWGMDGMCIPKGTANLEQARAFIKFCSNAQRQAEFAKRIAYGPVNPKAFDHIDPARAKLLPTNPEHFKTMVYQDPKGWGPAKDKAVEAFDAWIIKT
ncbi:ABC transporter substrate-binding protein [Mesorhizobium sp. M2C.T.Ca.TU.002.02.1.1]|uniref:polyamine ABC transporter substrate-binding protein n=1 Tax=Mesorhizobium sp. M2C.T.Ca.TU.002.02.1.1 TaxID=2496788 RepID=UPI000FCA4F06|nr:ABC transporter substrate-binding protein [Mesorhizobium sp. M2C.T.Ca.TU.002.02.1.1]RUU61309.1 extracellular solute-binding protein [Mesorhizobium sp. M2C.T.Ca.TU.002.02.1.1]RUU66506.1 extracellular solute-binding protein [Mesorhizobium sp. M2C.T.Ca.TU.009.01.2.1]